MKQWPKPGSIVSVPTHVFFRHKGIVSDSWSAGKPMVISASARVGRGAEEPWDVFSSGQEWRDEGFPGSLDPAEVLARARALQSRPYHPFFTNCDTFVLESHGLDGISVQLVVALAIAAAGVALAIAR